jgi:AraC family transcriptional regulator, positive regulator of tynA and feaB
MPVATRSDAPPSTGAMHASAAWARQIHQGLFPLSLEITHPGEEALVQTVAKVRPGCRLAHVQAPEHVARMTDDNCLSLAQPQVKVLWLHEGSAEFRQGRRRVDLQAGEWLLYEASRPYALSMSQGVDFSVMFLSVGEQDAWLQACREEAELSGRSISEASKLALSMVTAALAADVHLDQATCAAFALSMRSLLDTSLRLQDRHGAERLNASQQLGLLHQAKAFLMAHLTDMDVSPDRMAQALGVSRRRLYKAFEAAGERPQALLQQFRLQRCRELLQREEGVNLNLAQLAQEHGFSDAAHFSRAYKKAFGVPPSRARQGRLEHFRADAQDGGTQDQALCTQRQAAPPAHS